MPDHDDAPHETDPRPAQANLAAAVVAARQAADVRAAAAGPPIDAHVHAVLANCRIALGALAAQHAFLADHTDPRFRRRHPVGGPVGDSRAQLAYANALVDLSDRGHVDTALPTSRTLHETLGVLGVVNDDAEQTLLRRWFDDQEVQPKKVRAATERQAQRVAADAAEHGVELDVNVKTTAHTHRGHVVNARGGTIVAGRRSGVRFDRC